jgi:hypothetical protein
LEALFGSPPSPSSWSSMSSDFILHYSRRIGAPNLTDSRPLGCTTPKRPLSRNRSRFSFFFYRITHCNANTHNART